MPTVYAPSGLTWVTTVPIPADGESISEKNCAPAWRRCGDRAAYNKRTLPLVYSWATITGAPFWTYGNSAAIETTIASGGKIDVPDCTVGDKLFVSTSMTFVRETNMSKVFDVWLDAIDNALGVSPGTQTHVPGAHWGAANGLDADDSNIALPLSLSGMWTVVTAGTTRITLAASSATLSGGDELSIWPGFNISAVRFPVL